MTCSEYMAVQMRLREKTVAPKRQERIEREPTESVRP